MAVMQHSKTLELSEQRKARTSIAAATGLISSIVVFALLIVFAQRPLSVLITDGVSIYLALMVVLTLLVWVLTFAYMRIIAGLDASGERASSRGCGNRPASGPL